MAEAEWLKADRCLALALAALHEPEFSHDCERPNYNPLQVPEVSHDWEQPKKNKPLQMHTLCTITDISWDDSTWAIEHEHESLYIPAPDDLAHVYVGDVVVPLLSMKPMQVQKISHDWEEPYKNLPKETANMHEVSLGWQLPGDRLRLV